MSRKLSGKGAQAPPQRSSTASGKGFRPGEIGAIVKARGTAIPVALVYPNTYPVGMGNLGFQYVYQVLNSHPRIAAERFFLPDPGAGRNNDMRIVSEESGRNLRDFPLITFSVPFENDYPAVPRMLSFAGIPPLRKDRGPSDSIVIAGGVSVSINPEPLADFLEMAFIGEIPDAESSESGIVSILVDLFLRGIPDRAEFQERFRDVPGAYLPSAYGFDYGEDGVVANLHVAPGFPERVRAVKRRKKGSAAPVSVLFSPEAEFGDTLLVETNRGCGRGCRFCASGWIHLPVRHSEFDNFREQVQTAVADGRTVGLIGSDLAGHPELETILSTIVESGGKFSLSSIRPEGLNSKIIELLARTGQKTATLAPEVASPRLKKVIGKEIPSERFCELVEKLVAAGIPNVRFYFMIGLPTETDEDIRSIVEFVIECRKIFLDASRPLKRIGKIGVQVNPFVPKPWTPFQWAAMTPLDVLEKRMQIIRKELGKLPNLAIRIESPRSAQIQALLSRGDRRVAPLLLAAADRQGNWSRILKHQETSLDFYAYRERSEHEIFPWDVTDHGISKEALYRVYSRVISGK
ncbi:MAG: radical SAM protein [Desulfomonile tiedjei]|uniref:Radical SAM protein n=1 Tax=Desulfomonile tiedjei TaxID=2358 RepID=A0A9D6V606_9BACT|nr:radical SAM protein [Desulfomonile tiedjei]